MHGPETVPGSEYIRLLRLLPPLQDSQAGPLSHPHAIPSSPGPRSIMMDVNLALPVTSPDSKVLFLGLHPGPKGHYARSLEDPGQEPSGRASSVSKPENHGIFPTFRC